MQIDLFAIGRMKKGPESELFDSYLNRAQKAGRGLGISELHPFTPNESRKATADLRKADEAEMLLAKLPNNAMLIALDERGEDMDSRTFANLVQNGLDRGFSSLTFAIGGPDGHGEALLSQAIKTVRFGKMTWPHQLVRILLAEQIYRAITILNGHPYHRD